MRRRVAIYLAVATVVVMAFAGCGGVPQPQAERACGKAVLSDWADGRIDRAYPDPCYEAAIDTMPEDLRAYSTAKDDISRELYSRRSVP
jgi:hypothetical protein